MVQQRFTSGPTLHTLGYEGHTADTFAHALLQNGIERVLDVRESPYSRKPGFSKQELKLIIEATGADYHHIPELGSPAALRERLRYGSGPVDFAAEYTEHLDANEAALDRLQHLAGERPSAMLCVEKRPEDCHRRFIARYLREREWTVIDL